MPLLWVLWASLLLSPGAQAQELKVALAGVVGEGQARSLAPLLTQRLGEELAKARVPNALFIRLDAGPGGLDVAKVRELGRSAGADKVIISKALYRFGQKGEASGGTSAQTEQEWVVRLSVMYVIVDVASGNVERRKVVDYRDRVPELFLTLYSAQERQRQAVEAALPLIRDSITQTAADLAKLPR